MMKMMRTVGEVDENDDDEQGCIWWDGEFC
jgi:hypothetical protein